MLYMAHTRKPVALDDDAAEGDSSNDRQWRLPDVLALLGEFLLFSIECLQEGSQGYAVRRELSYSLLQYTCFRLVEYLVVERKNGMSMTWRDFVDAQVHDKFHSYFMGAHVFRDLLKYI